MKLRDLFHPFAFYVSNKDADGLIYSMTVPMVVAFIVTVLGMLNAVLWSAIGLVEAIKYIV